MNKNSNIVIIGVIVMIVIILGVYSSQVTNNEQIENNDKQNENEKIDFDTGNEEIDKKLEDIVNDTNNNYFEPATREWIRSGPFEIDRSKYHIGEKIFLRIGNLYPDEKGQIAFLKQTNETHYTVFQTIPFDGTNKPAFNYYTDIRLSIPLQLCTVEDILGEWTVVFRGTNYPNIDFEIIDKYIPGEEDAFVPVC